MFNIKTESPFDTNFSFQLRDISNFDVSEKIYLEEEEEEEEFY